MRKLGILLLALMMVVGTVGCGAKTKDKELTKKEVEKNEAVEDTVDEDVKTESVEEEKAMDETSSEEIVDTQADTSQSTTKNDTSKNTSNNPTNSTTNITSTTKPSQTVTQPTTGHVHNWTEVKTQVAVPEKGHYESIYGWKYVCDACQQDITDLIKANSMEHFQGDCWRCVYTPSCVEVGKEWVVDTPATTEARVTGYKCSCGTTREKTQYAGMYTLKDQASWDRIDACKTVMQSGIRSEFSKVHATYEASYWDSVHVCNSSSSGAWMWIFLSDWKLDDYSYLQDAVAEGIVDQEEAQLVEVLYEEIPKVFKGCIEKIAPQGGTELYNYVEKLIVQANGLPYKVSDLDGAQGLIPENIPGLYVTIEETRGGFSLMFWAE